MISKIANELVTNKILITKKLALTFSVNATTKIKEDISKIIQKLLKGLKWDYVFIPKITESQFPSYKGLCQDCKKNNCIFTFTFSNELKSRFLEQLSIYYVAIIRAKINVYLFTNIQNNKFVYPKNLSLITLPNLNYNDIF